MSSNKCDLNCEKEQTDTSHTLNDVEKEILMFRFGLDLVHLCDQHYPRPVQKIHFLAQQKNVLTLEMNTRKQGKLVL